MGAGFYKLAPTDDNNTRPAIHRVLGALVWVQFYIFNSFRRLIITPRTHILRSRGAAADNRAEESVQVSQNGRRCVISHNMQAAVDGALKSRRSLEHKNKIEEV